jgi:hypothetical protein
MKAFYCFRTPRSERLARALVVIQPHLAPPPKVGLAAALVGHTMAIENFRISILITN